MESTHHYSFQKKYGPWALVTGASDGIGREVAIELAKKGINLIVIARREDKLKALAEEILAISAVQITPVALDVSEPKSTDTIADLSKKYDIGLFAAIAGFGSSGQFAEQQLSSELNMIEVNCTSVVAQTHHFANLFKRKGRGGIILMGSLVGFQGVPYTATYAATKAFMQSFAEALYFELKPYGIDVLCSAPGPVHTGFATRANMILAQASHASEVAKKTISSLGFTLTVRPGFLSKFLGWSLITLPRIWRVKIMGLIMGKMSGVDFKNPRILKK